MMGILNLFDLRAEVSRLRVELEETREALAGADEGRNYANELLTKLSAELEAVKKDAEHYRQRGYELAEQLASCQRDTERYRWLREPNNYEHDLWLHHKLADLCEEELDAAIDAAISSEKKHGME